MEADLAYEGDVEEELGVGVAAEDGCGGEALAPGFLNDGSAGAWGGFVEGSDGGKGDLSV